MSPIPNLNAAASTLHAREVTKPTNPDGLILEAWAQGYMVGSLIILSCITVANMRRGNLLHKLILIELVFGYWQGFFIFFHPPIYAWWLSVAAIPLNVSWSLHNVISWIKIKPFLSKKVSMVFIGTVILVQPYWVVEIYANFAYFHNVNDIFLKTRPWEALCRDPWWIVTTVFLFYNIKTKYDLSLPQIIRISPRFAIMLVAMILSICFIILDVCSVTDALKSALPVGINPFWKLSFVFKCLTDAVILDDFKTALDRLRAFKMGRLGSFDVDVAENFGDGRGSADDRANSWRNPRPGVASATPSPEDDSFQRPEWEKSDSQSTHVEAPSRNASRDHDLEENGIDARDHNLNSQPNVAAGSKHQGSLLRNTSFTEESDVQAEYANALRQITKVGLTNHHLESGNGKAN